MLAALGGARPGGGRGAGPGASGAGGTNGPRSGGAGGGATARTPSAAAAVLTEGQKTVWVLREGKPMPVTITTGVSDGTLTEVTEGALKPGDAGHHRHRQRTGASAPAGGPPRRLF